MGTALAIVDADSCPDCAAATVELAFSEPALFRHGGYGAERHTMIRHCASFCGWWIRRHVTERRPARVAA